MYMSGLWLHALSQHLNFDGSYCFQDKKKTQDFHMHVEGIKEPSLHPMKTRGPQLEPKELSI